MVIFGLELIRQNGVGRQGVKFETFPDLSQVAIATLVAIATVNLSHNGDSSPT